MSDATDEAGAPLPEILPVFPLSGVLLLPGAHLPLHVFEPRYRNLVSDVLSEHRIFGLVQPRAGGPDEGTRPELYAVGCAGKIEQISKLEDGRFLVLLVGLQRFRIREERPLRRGYRRVVALYDDYAGDLAEPRVEIEAQPLRDALRRLAAAKDVELPADRLAELEGRALLNSVAMALPLSPPEKQALLEAADIHERHTVLLSLMEMELSGGSNADGSGLTH